MSKPVGWIDDYGNVFHIDATMWDGTPWPALHPVYDHPANDGAMNAWEYAVELAHSLNVIDDETHAWIEREVNSQTRTATDAHKEPQP